MFIAMAGAMSTAEIGISLAEMIRRDKVHGICCTAANLEEDIFNLFAHEEYVMVPNYRDLSPEDEKQLLDNQDFVPLAKAKRCPGVIVHGEDLVGEDLHRRGVPVVFEHLFVGPDLLEPGFDLKTGLVDKGAGALLAVDGALMFQLAEGVTDGGAAHAEILGKGRFWGDPTVLELVVDDLLFDVSLDLIGE